MIVLLVLGYLAIGFIFAIVMEYISGEIDDHYERDCEEHSLFGPIIAWPIVVTIYIIFGLAKLCDWSIAVIVKKLRHIIRGLANNDH